MGGCMAQKVGSGQKTNLIKLELINIIWFSLKIYNLLRHPYLWVDGCINWWAHVKPLKSNKSWPNWDNSIMDILDILLDILLKPPQPLMGLFLLNAVGLFAFQWNGQYLVANISSIAISPYQFQLWISISSCCLFAIILSSMFVPFFSTFSFGEYHTHL